MGYEEYNNRKEKIYKELQADIKNLDIDSKNVVQFLTSSPYDFSENMDKLMTSSIFENLLRVEDELRYNLSLFKDKIDSKFNERRIISLSGHSGCGKTTFLNYFINNTNICYDNLYIDFNEIDNPNNNTLIEDDVEEVIRSIIINPNNSEFSLSEEDVYIGLKFMLDHIGCYRRNKWISKDFIELLKKNNIQRIRESPNVFDDDDLISVLEEACLNDVLIMFFTILFNRRDIDSLGLYEYKTPNKCLVYFDNLDTLNLNHLSNSVVVKFIQVYRTANKMSQHKIFREDIYFTSRYYFVFSLREPNAAKFNSHFLDRTKMLLFNVRFSSQYYSKILGMRMKFLDEFSKLFAGDTMIQAIKNIIQDSYFEDVFVRLANCNYRIVIKMIQGVLSNISTNKFELYNLSEVIDNSNSVRKDLSYGVRGDLMYYVFNNLRVDGFLRDYGKEIQADASENGYCYIDRIILTVLLNTTNYQVNSKKYDRSITGKLYSDLIKHVIGMYSSNEIFDSLYRMFHYHTCGWSNLITIYNKSIVNISDFDDTKGFLEELKGLKQIEDNEEGHKNVSERILELIKLIDNIEIKVNPSGYSYVKYVLTHFEFYNNMGSYDLSLFDFVYNGNEFNHDEFRRILNSVFKVIEIHCRLMNLFYLHKMRSKIEDDNFCTSVYCLKIIGNKKKAKGYFHSIRIITSFIDYLDNFRLEYFNKFGNDYSFNEYMVGFIRRLVEMIKESNDERAIRNFYPRFKKKIQYIENNSYEDCDYPIAIS
ncbi:MAG: hypothetical protein WBB45_03640 [Cyclobacteriaceae bacterium]